MTSFWKKHIYHFLVLALLIAIAAIGWTVQIPSSAESEPALQEAPEILQESSSSSTEAQGSPVSKKRENVYNTVDIFDTADIEKEASLRTERTDDLPTDEPNETAYNQLIVGGKKYRLSYTNERSVYDLMLALQTESDLTFEKRYYGAELGYFITTINGKKNDDDPGYFWIYYVNDKKATIGISNYILKPQDIIEWKYEESEL